MAPDYSWKRERPPLADLSILIVEDEPLVALDVHRALSAAGASIISALSVREAIDLIGYADISAAIVDVQLGAQDAAKVCDLLAQRKIPFVFYTGRSARAPLLAQWPHIPVIKKPATSTDIVSTLIFVARSDTDS
jgi:CheY-like chemotaxis protein